MITLDHGKRNKLRSYGVDIWGNIQSLPLSVNFEPPCATKSVQIGPEVSIGAFSYAVSGHIMATLIGRYCSFGEDVQIGRQNHPSDWVTTSPFVYMKGSDVINVETQDQWHWKNSPQYKYSHLSAPTSMQKTTIGHDVWIGHGAFLKAGITVGTGSIIGAMAVVTKDVEPYSIVVGNPGKTIRYRFSPEIIAKLLQSKWWEYSPQDIEKMHPHNIEEFLSIINSNPSPKYIPKKILLSDFNF